MIAMTTSSSMSVNATGALVATAAAIGLTAAFACRRE
jgi:hypothetical protein